MGSEMCIRDSDENVIYLPFDAVENRNAGIKDPASGGSNKKTS